jgi:hypothetical protein
MGTALPDAVIIESSIVLKDVDEEQESIQKNSARDNPALNRNVLLLEIT